MKRRKAIAIALAAECALFSTGCAEDIKIQKDAGTVVSATREAATTATTLASEVGTSNTVSSMTSKSTSKDIATTAESSATTELSSTTCKSTATSKSTTSTEDSTTVMEDNTTMVSSTSTTTTTSASVSKTEIMELPQSLLSAINQNKKRYPKMKVAYGLFALDGSAGYGYNIDQVLNGACSLKAPYAWYVFLTCQKKNINIWDVKIAYNDSFYDTGSGSIKKSVDAYYKTHSKSKYKFTQSYSVGYLLNLLTTVSDNIAYKMLLTKFKLSDYNEFLKTIGGQKFWAGQTYGQASVRQRFNEWMGILNYINSKQKYSQLLSDNLHNTQFCSLVIGMKNKHDYLHKSGWNEGTNYNAACDVAVIDGQYLVIIMTQDDTCKTTRNDVVRSMGLATESYVAKIGGYKNLFKK